MMKSIALLVAFASSASAFSGQATFYGQGGAGQGGACMLQRGFNGVGVTVAINQAQWDGSGNCGKCIKMTGQGAGQGGTPVFGPIYATVDNLCPECKFGDIDLGLGGDGRWEMQWNFVDCGEAASAWSQLPGGKRMLRGADDSVDASKPLMIGPGMYLMPEGVKDLETVKAMGHAGNGTMVAAAINGGN